MTIADKLLQVNSNLGEISDEVSSQTDLIAQINAALEGKGAGSGSGGTILPKLTDEGAASELFLGKQLISSTGQPVTGTFTIEDELSEQNDLISQISQLVASKANPQGGVTLPTLNNPASTADILSGKEAIDGDGNKLTGSIATKTSSDLTASGATVTVPAGYYASEATKSVTTTTQATPSISVDTNGKITASVTQSAGYVTGGLKTGTKQLTTQAAKTITPTKSSQTAVASGVYTTGAVTVAAIPSSYIQPSGTKEVTTNGTHDVKSYASVNVNVASTGEDVTTETNAYTEKITQLTAAVTALETELADKASGGGGSIQTYTGTVYGVQALGEVSDALYLYTDETLTSRAEAVPARASTTITIAAGTSIMLASADGFASMSESERLEALYTNGVQYALVFVPTHNDFELYI